jgi:hypothetical protein
VKSKHATNKSGIRNSKSSGKTQNDGVSKSKSKKPKSKGPPPKPQKSAGNLATLKKKRRVYTEKELDIPKLNMITPIGVEKPKGTKKGKVFVDDRVSRLPNFHSMAGLIGCVGEYDDYSGNGERRQGGPNRVEDDEGATDGGDSRGEESRDREEAGDEEIEAR